MRCRSHWHRRSATPEPTYRTRHLHGPPSATSRNGRAGRCSRDVTAVSLAAGMLRWILCRRTVCGRLVPPLPSWSVTYVSSLTRIAAPLQTYRIDASDICTSSRRAPTTVDARARHGHRSRRRSAAHFFGAAATGTVNVAA